MSKRKQVTMTVTVSVPEHLTARDARREVRTLVAEQCNYRSDLDVSDIKVISVKPSKAEA